ncbi:Arc family DNA-binding protein [Tranquillimonas rosea]|uniref:Arc family DNA-binding protein n=1 Tax=Tranquillimonas rosea TaxID=641238 RepID=UPI003BAD3265
MQYKFMMPADLKRRIETAAHKNHRSVSSEVVAALAEAFPVNGETMHRLRRLKTALDVLEVVDGSTRSEIHRSISRGLRNELVEMRQNAVNTRQFFDTDEQYQATLADMDEAISRTEYLERPPETDSLDAIREEIRSISTRFGLLKDLGEKAEDRNEVERGALQAALVRDAEEHRARLSELVKRLEDKAGEPKVDWPEGYSAVHHPLTTPSSDDD